MSELPNSPIFFIEFTDACMPPQTILYILHCCRTISTLRTLRKVKRRPEHMRSQTGTRGEKNSQPRSKWSLCQIFLSRIEKSPLQAYGRIIQIRHKNTRRKLKDRRRTSLVWDRNRNYRKKNENRLFPKTAGLSGRPRQASSVQRK